MKKSPDMVAISLACLLILNIGESEAAEPTVIEKKLALLEAQNKILLERLTALENKLHNKDVLEPASESDSVVLEHVESDEKSYVQINHKFAYDMLNPNTDINRKERVILDAKNSQQLSKDSVYLAGAVTGIANYQTSNTESKFGYLMRHPTSNNQRTQHVSEALIHSAQLSVLANLEPWISAYAELLYSPELSFGPGTTTALGRNQVQVRQGYVLFGDLNQSPFYGSLGKMAIPFGLNDTVNPFTQSTVYHAFGGLAYGLKAGYSDEQWNITAMAVQGGAQFRAANVPVDGTNIPSKLNNFAFDLNYTVDINTQTALEIGGSYIKGSAYCQSFPVTHFSACEKENAAYSIYSLLDIGDIKIKSELVQTQDVWQGTFNPAMPQFNASKVTSFDFGILYQSDLVGKEVDYSFEFSQFDAGPDGAPWERQDQWVIGAAFYPVASAKLFAEIIKTKGYAPLNFISGGNFEDGSSWSVRDAQSTILMFGTNIAF